MNKIKELRKLHNLNQAQLAQVCNTSISNISGWELEKWQPSNNDLVTLANYFNVSIDYLLNRTDYDITFKERTAGASGTRRTTITTDEKTPKEEELLHIFRNLPPELQDAVLSVAQTFAGQNEQAEQSQKTILQKKA